MTYTHPHPYSSNFVYEQQVDGFPNAIELEISFGDFSETKLNEGFVVLCKNSTCLDNWGNYSGSTFPGKLSNSALIIRTTELFIQFTSAGVNSENNWGFELTVTPIYTYGMFPSIFISTVPYYLFIAVVHFICIFHGTV